MDDLRQLLTRAAEHAAAYRATLPDTPVSPAASVEQMHAAFGGSLPDSGTTPEKVLDELITATRDGLMASAGPRFFGFVTGGALPSATAAEILTAGWDQNAFNATHSPAAIAAELAVGDWLKDLLRLPVHASVGFVTGAQAANTVGLAAGRHHVLARAGWDVERDGLGGAPRVRIVANEQRHATIDRSLRLLGLGTGAVAPVHARTSGAIDLNDLASVLHGGGHDPAIVCLQAGNVNTGACDDLRAACDLAHEHGAWVHIDGAFGLWAAANPATRHLVDGVDLADSWACDAHKWLNVPYDSAFAICAHPQAHAAAMSLTAAYLVGSGSFIGGADYTMESSRRARAFAVWAALRELGRDGVAELVDRCCRLARRFADRLRDAGFEVANDVVLNQVLVRFGDDQRTDTVIEAIQRDGTCWMGGTSFNGRRYMRISVSNHGTTESDVDRSVAAIVRLARV